MLQVPGQLRPPGPVTRPLPDTVTVSRGRGGPKVAETVRSPVIVTVQAVPPGVPAQAPPQPSCTLPGLGVALRMTRCPASKAAAHVLGQLMPPVPLMTPLVGDCTVSTGRVTGRVATRSVMELVAVRLSGKVACTLTWELRGVSHWWFTRRPMPPWPSPKSQRAAVGSGPPGTPVARRVTGSPTKGSVLETTIRTLGCPGTGGDGGSGGLGGSGCGGGVLLGGALSGVSGCCGWSTGGCPAGGCPADGPSPPPAPGLCRLRSGWAGSYLATGVNPPSRSMTPACSLSGSLKNTSPSRVSSWNFVRGWSTWGRATTRAPARSTIQT